MSVSSRFSHVTQVECPRDSWQGFSRVIPTAEKVTYLKQLVTAGFTHIDFASFVSPKEVPQMRDAEQVWTALRDDARGVYAIAIVVNARGLDRALAVGGIPAVGYPLSLSSEFQRRNTGMTMEEAWSVLGSLRRRTSDAGIDLNVYLSMGFGNPYGEPWSVAHLVDTLARVRDSGVSIVMLADTIGCATAPQIKDLFTVCRSRCPDVAVGAHFHAAPDRWRANVEAALEAGCERIDSALGGIGGCPFAQDALVGNVPTEGVWNLLELSEQTETFSRALEEAKRLYREYH
jgi:hydroxymethylglutaryl-CoA lyase